MTEHYKKKAMRDKMNKLLDLLAKHEKLSSGDLERMLQVSAPTLSNYTKELQDNEIIERYQGEDSRFAYWRIKASRRSGIEAHLSNLRAIRFLEGLHDPIYVYEETPDKKGAVAVFASIQNKPSKIVEALLKSMVLYFARTLPRYTKPFSLGDKLALVVMIGEGVKP